MRYWAERSSSSSAARAARAMGSSWRVGADGFKIMLIGEVGVGAAGKTGAEDVAHGLDDVFLPEKAVAAAGAEVADVEVGDAAKALHLLPKAGFGAGVEDVELELGEFFEAGAGFEFIDGGESVDLPHGCLGPKSMETEGKLAIFGGEFEGGEAEVALQPFEESGLEDAAAAVEGVAGEPDEFGLVEAQAASFFELLAEFVDGNDVSKANGGAAVEEGEGGLGGGEVFPDELEHEEFIEVGVEERARDGVEFPVVVVRATGDVDYHSEFTLSQRGVGWWLKGGRSGRWRF